MSENGPETPASGRRTLILAVVLLVILGALYAVVPVVPFLPLAWFRKG